MKNRLHDKKAGIFILIALILISVAEVGFRHMCLRDMIATTANYAETLAVIGLALAIIIFTLKGKDRVCYILYGAWAAYFILDQVFELPGVIADTYRLLSQAESMITFSKAAPIIRIFSMCGIISIGGLLVEYLNDGTIYNRAFNIICVATVILILVNIATSLITGIQENLQILFLETFNALYRIAMVFLVTFFAYDSAKKQLLKVDFSK